MKLFQIIFIAAVIVFAAQGAHADGTGMIIGLLNPSKTVNKDEVSKADVRALKVDGTRIMVKREDGSWASGKDLVGSLLISSNASGFQEIYRIDSVIKRKTEFAGELYFYEFSTQSSDTGGWVNFCEPDVDGKQWGFPVGGYWDENGDHVQSKDNYLVTCTSGAIGMCVLMGYLPWKKGKGGQSLWPYHQACVRMVRADYCGNGNSHSRNGILVEMWDRLGIQEDSKVPDLTFEAAWNQDGAVCMKKSRIPKDFPLDKIIKECPERLNGKAGDKASCKESFDDKKVLILNRS